MSSGITRFRWEARWKRAYPGQLLEPQSLANALKISVGLADLGLETLAACCDEFEQPVYPGLLAFELRAQIGADIVHWARRCFECEGLLNPGRCQPEVQVFNARLQVHLADHQIEQFH